jgi:hypothetical protein
MSRWWQLERRPASPWEGRLIGWFTGPVPAKGATLLEQLQFARRVTGRTMLFYVPVLSVLLIFGTPAWVTAAICALFLFGGANVVAITLKVRRAEKAEREGR